MKRFRRRVAVFLALLLSAPFACPAGDLSQQEIATLPKDEIERRIISEHPAFYYLYAARLFAEDAKNEAIFWFYAGQLRWRFHMAANPGLPQDQDPALFASLNSVVGTSINKYAGEDPDNWVKQIENVLEWDQRTPNSFTSKEKHKREYDEVRHGLVKFKEYVVSNRQALLDRHRMPRDWPALKRITSVNELNGVYIDGKDSLLGPCLFSYEASRVIRARYYQLTATAADKIKVVAFDDHKTYGEREIRVVFEDGAVTFRSSSTAAQLGLAEGGGTMTTYLRLNDSGELVIQRDAVTEGTYRKGTKLFKDKNTFWNRAQRKQS